MTCQFWYKYAFKFLLFRSQWYQWYVTNQMIRENLDIAPIKTIIREKCSKHVENIEPRELLVNIRNGILISWNLEEFNGRHTRRNTIRGSYRIQKIEDIQTSNEEKEQES